MLQLEDLYYTPDEEAFDYMRFDKRADLEKTISSYAKYGFEKVFTKILCEAYLNGCREAIKFMDGHGFDDSHVYAYMDMIDELRDYLYQQQGHGDRDE